MNKLVSVSDITIGRAVQGFFLVKTKSIRQAKNGKWFLDATLLDGTGEIRAKQWDIEENTTFDFEVGDPVAVKGMGDEFDDRPQIIIEKIRTVRLDDEEYGFKPEKLVPTTDYDVNEMWDEVIRVIETVSDNDIKNLLKQIYRHYEKQIKEYPAAVKVHHAFRGGLLEHSLSILKDCLYYAEKFDDLNRNLLIAGALLHDIGKIVELSDDLVTQYTDDGNLIGHIVIGQNIIHEFIQNISSFPRDKQLQIEHIILSHQGRFEWSSPRLPLTKEAFLIHYLDEIDAKLNIFRNAVNEVSDNATWTAKNPYLQRVLYKKGT